MRRPNGPARIARVEQRVGAAAVAVGQALDFAHGRELPRAEQPVRHAAAQTRAQREIPSASGRTALGLDHDDAVGRARAVHRGRGRRLEHFDRLDLLRIQIRDAVHQGVLAPADASRGGARAGAGHGVGAGGKRVVGDDDAVDDEQRLARAENRRDAADLHLRAAAGSAAVHRDHRAGDLALERLLERLGGRPVEVLGVHARDGGRRVTLLDRRRLTRHDHRVELERILLERDGDIGLAGGHVDLLPLEADGADEQLRVAVRDDDAERAVISRLRYAGTADLDDGGADDRHVTERAANASRHLAPRHLRAGCRRQQAECQ